MKLKIVEFETAKKLKEVGFNLIDPMHSNSISYTSSGKLHSKNTGFETPEFPAPTQALVQMWLREQYDIHININPRYHPKKLGEKLFYAYDLSHKENYYSGLDDNLNEWIGLNDEHKSKIKFHTFGTYEQALEAGILEAIKLIKTK